MDRSDEINCSSEVPAQGQRLRVPMPAAGHCSLEVREGSFVLRQ